MRLLSFVSIERACLVPDVLLGERTSVKTNCRARRIVCVLSNHNCVDHMRAFENGMQNALAFVSSIVTVCVGQVSSVLSERCITGQHDDDKASLFAKSGAPVGYATLLAPQRR